MILYQDPFSYRNFFGLYGAYEKNCTEFNLSPHASKIECIVEFMSNGKEIVSYKGDSGLEYLDGKQCC